jgi:glyoxylase-like metal-dependent hydrolase (beta-lactamase superfamily II)
MSHQFEVTAVRYGELATSRSDNFYRYGVYGEPDAPMPMDYFFWIVRDGTSTTLVDTGYHPDALTNRPGRVCLTPPMAALEVLGISPESVDRVVVTHFHFDHIGNVKSFPNARISLQQQELDFWLSPYARHRAAAASVEAGEIEFLRLATEQGRVDVLDGDGAIAPGIEARLVVGHCPGQQIIIIDNEQPVVLASDALHFYEEMTRDMPYEVFTDLTGMYRTYELLRELEVRSGAAIIAGHDPEVMQRFAPVTEHPDLAVRIS